MKYFNNIKKYIIIVLILFIIIIVFNYFRLDIHHLFNKKNYIDTFKVYGNDNNYVPQGLSYSDKYDVVLQTSYNAKDKVSKLYVINFSSGKLIKELDIKYENGNNNTDHVGGIATNNETVWITKDYIQSYKTVTLPIRGDFCYYHDGKLWIGDFYLKHFYDVPDDTPLLMQYNANNVDYYEPNLIISLPKMVQGMTITDNDEFVFTSSFTNLKKSDLSFYKDVTKDKSDKYSLNGIDIPYYHFNKSNLIKKEKLPPMAEGLFYKDNNLYILFENSSNHYFYAYPKMKYVIKYKIK